MILISLIIRTNHQNVQIIFWGCLSLISEFDEDFNQLLLWSMILKWDLFDGRWPNKSYYSMYKQLISQLSSWNTFNVSTIFFIIILNHMNFCLYVCKSILKFLLHYLILQFEKIFVVSTQLKYFHANSTGNLKLTLWRHKTLTYFNPATKCCQSNSFLKMSQHCLDVKKTNV